MATAFLRKHENDSTVHKLKFNEPLTGDDLAALEDIFTAEESAPEEIEVAKKEGDGLGLLVRSLIGLDREAAKEALSGFLKGKNLSLESVSVCGTGEALLLIP